MSSLKLLFSSLLLSISALFGPHSSTGIQAPVLEVPVVTIEEGVIVDQTQVKISQTQSSDSGATIEQKKTDSTVVQVGTWNGLHVYTHDELLTMADNKYADGEVPLGDGKYSTTNAKKGYVYLCNARQENFGSNQNGPWIHNTTWNFLSKYMVSGSVSWPNAAFSNIISGTSRILSGNGLPISHTTGKFPVSSSDKVYQYDRNPNTISAQSIKDTVSANPTYSATPYCMGGEAGIMLSGVALFNALDAPLRDAPAHEAQDSCGGHPQESGEYHYHSLSPCFKDISVQTVLGYAFDGFPITGPQVTKDRYLTTDDLDVCHGIVSEIVQDGKAKTTYHYVMTQDYPYSVSCFRSKSSFAGPTAQTKQSEASSQTQVGAQMPAQGGTLPTPPQEAQDACDNLDEGASCSVGGQVMGTCKVVGEYFACIPNR